MNQALFVLSTGRCGTQWLADVLNRALGERVVVTHEPMNTNDAARRMLGGHDPALLSR